MIKSNVDMSKVSYLMNLWDVIKKTAKRWNEADPFRQSAIIAFYAVFSLPALLVIIVVVAGYFFGQEAVSGKISEQIDGMMGGETAKAVEEMIANAMQTEASTLATIFGIIVLLFGATTVFIQLQKSLNRIWGIRVKPEKAFMKYLRDRLLSFGLILVIGFLLLVSLVLTSILAILGDWLQSFFPDFIVVLFYILNFLISLFVVSVLFAMMFKILPDANIRWRSVWVGAVVTALLFELGKFALGIYFGKAQPESVYGGAGSIVLILLWVSYVCMILFFGAEFTKEYAIKFGHGITPKENSELVEDISNCYHDE